MRKNASRTAVIRRHLRLRQKITGTADRPRLSVFRSLANIYAQVIDDTTGTTPLRQTASIKNLRLISLTAAI